MQVFIDQKTVTERLAYFGELFLNIKYLTSNVGLFSKESSFLEFTLKGENKVLPPGIADSLIEGLVSGFQTPQRMKIFFSSNPYIQ